MITANAWFGPVMPGWLSTEGTSSQLVRSRGVFWPESSGAGLLGHGYHYRTTVAPWFRGPFTGSPDVHVAVSAPVIYQVHATTAWTIWAVWPFSRLVHTCSYPLWYLWRPYSVYRSRHPAAAEPDTSGRRWRKIGVPY